MIRDPFSDGAVLPGTGVTGDTGEKKDKKR
jgi:hypothetical protein